MKNHDIATDRPRVLIVEDEVLIAEELKERLVALGFCVVAAVDTAEESIAVATSQRPDLVLMDIRLKGVKDGIQAAREIRRQVDLPIVYLTAYSDTRTVEQAKQSPHDAYLLKPFQHEELLSTIEVAMQRHALRTRSSRLPDPRTTQ
jgi:two-component system, response regulator PdtaR